MITLYDSNGNGVTISVTSSDLKELQQRNEIRLQEAKQKLGAKYLLHPSNMRKRLETPR